MQKNIDHDINVFKICLNTFNHFNVQIFNHEFKKYMSEIPSYNNFDCEKTIELLDKVLNEKTNGLHDYTIEIGRESSLVIYVYLNYVIAEKSEYSEKIEKENQKFQWIAKYLNCDEFNMIQENWQIKFRLWWD